jgi:hypothetical protein
MLSIVTTFWNALLKSFDAISTKPKSASVEISLIIWERKRINGKLHHAYESKLVYNRLPEKLKEVLNSIL